MYLSLGTLNTNRRISVIFGLNNKEQDQIKHSGLGCLWVYAMFLLLLLLFFFLTLLCSLASTHCLYLRLRISCGPPSQSMRWSCVQTTPYLRTSLVVFAVWVAYRALSLKASPAMVSQKNMVTQNLLESFTCDPKLTWELYLWPKTYLRALLVILFFEKFIQENQKQKPEIQRIFDWKINFCKTKKEQ